MALASRAQPPRNTAGKALGLRILTETWCDLADLDRAVRRLSQIVSAGQQWHQYEPLARDSAYRGAVLAFGKPVNTYYDFTKADVVVSLDSDFLSCSLGNLRYVADFMSRRRVSTIAAEAKTATMNRLYVIETAVSPTGAKADHRFAVKPSAIEALARSLARELQVPDLPASGALAGRAPTNGRARRHGPERTRRPTALAGDDACRARRSAVADRSSIGSRHQSPSRQRRAHRRLHATDYEAAAGGFSLDKCWSRPQTQLLSNATNHYAAWSAT